MIQFRIGTSPAAKRVDAIGVAFQRDREAEQRRRLPVAIAVEPAAPAEGGSARDWAAEQIAAWARRQPHIVATVKPRWRTIVEEVAALYGVAVDDLTGPSRTADLIAPRFEAMYRILDETPMTLPEVGRRFGGRDHTTVLHAVRKHAALNGLPLPRQDEEQPL